ncbi:MAG: LacI family DNA-binding transcriptional regulator [Anaerolineaceae bacterium]|nr:LacI family DNA-binding transcriptional regulator [Anaerolineaceae bacterium]
MPITLNELAKAAGVSASTVSRALNESEHPVNDETRQRILALANELGYRPNMVARSLKMDRTYAIGIIVDNIVSPFSPTIIRGIQDELKSHNYYSVIMNTDWDPEVETEAIHQLISRSIDGIIFVESWLRGANPTLDLANKPYVFVHRLFSKTFGNSVLVDEQYGARLAVEHLARLGHRRIAFINGPQGWDASADRLTGYKDVLAQLGIPYDPELVEEGNWEVQSGYPAAKKFLALAQRPTAIFAANDLMGLGAIYAIQEAGLRVPEDIALVGYDDREIASLARPTITTVTLPCYEMGQASASLLLSRLENQSEVTEPIRIQGKLIIRESCGAEKGMTSPERYRTHTTPPELLQR